MSDSNTDVRFVTEAVPQLQDYLLSNELYWPLSGSLPRLTPGSLLLALARLQVSAPLEARRWGEQIESIRNKWRSAWEKKAAREAANRLRLWSQYLSDTIAAPDQNMDSYRTEVRGRAILQILLANLPDAPETAALAELDAHLKKHLVPGEFIWETDLQAAFPRKEFWFLYGNL
ncbi:MAG TPA: hypothetical protein VGK00_13585 [Anaerolineales bacterium]|jgi:hypothetical protein